MKTLKTKTSPARTQGRSYCNRLLPAAMLSMALPLGMAGAPPNEAEAKPSISKAEKRLATATATLREAFSKKEKHVPTDLLRKADCVGVFPSVWKGALIIGGRYGQGFVSCRLPAGGWSGPASFRIEGGNIGFQIGGTSTDLVLLFNGEQSISKLLRTKFTLGVDSAAAAGPVGTDGLGRNRHSVRSGNRGLFPLSGRFCGDLVRRGNHAAYTQSQSPHLWLRASGQKHLAGAGGSAGFNAAAARAAS